MRNAGLLVLVITTIVLTVFTTYIYWELVDGALKKWANSIPRPVDVVIPQVLVDTNATISSSASVSFAQQLLKEAMNFSDMALKNITDAIISSQQAKDPGLKVISYGLYGDSPRYTDGAHANAELAPKIYPGWTMRVYHDNSVPSQTLQFLRDRKVELIDMTNDPMRNRMTWRFLPSGEPNVDIFISRDIDSRLSPREHRAVREWEDSNLPFHVLRDHPSHSRFSVSGGMWGSKANALPDMRQRLLQSALADTYLTDMNFLNSQIWPIMEKKGVMVHDSFNCDRSKTKPFPSPRIGTEHVGSVYIDGHVRQGDADILQRAINDGQPKC